MRDRNESFVPTFFLPILFISNELYNLKSRKYNVISSKLICVVFFRYESEAAINEANLKRSLAPLFSRIFAQIDSPKVIDLITSSSSNY